MNRTTLAGAVLTAAVVGAYATHGYASAGEPVRNIPLHCVEHVNHEGDASIGHCRTLPFRATHMPFWTARDCQNAHEFNCFARDPGDGGVHPHFRVQDGKLVCVFFSGARTYAQAHDYCVSESGR